MAHDRAGIAGPVQGRADGRGSGDTCLSEISAGLHPADPAARGDEFELFTQAQGPEGKLLMRNGLLCPARGVVLRTVDHAERQVGAELAKLLG